MGCSTYCGQDDGAPCGLYTANHHGMGASEILHDCFDVVPMYSYNFEIEFTSVGFQLEISNWNPTEIQMSWKWPKLEMCSSHMFLGFSINTTVCLTWCQHNCMLGSLEYSWNIVGIQLKYSNCIPTILQLYTRGHNIQLLWQQHSNYFGEIT